MNSYVDFVLLERRIGRKTDIYKVVAKSDGFKLGIVKWGNKWRQYIFEPDAGTWWSPGCLTEIIKFINKLMQERRDAIRH